MQRRVASFGACDGDFWSSVEKLRHTLRIASTSDCPGLSENGDRVVSKQELLSKMNDVFREFIGARANGGNSALMIPNRRVWQNTQFDSDRGIALVENPILRAVGSGRSSKRLVLLQHLLVQIYRLVQSDSYKTKRELYYDDVALYRSQSVVDGLLDDIGCLLGVSRTQLHVLTTSKGCIAGRLRFKDAEGNDVDCSDTGRGVLIPNKVRGISDIRSDARLVLVVEKSAVYEMLLDNDVTTLLHPCIIVTGKGFPDVNTREMLKKLRDALRIPILGLFDADPYGIEILGTYKYGSKAMAFDVSRLAVPEMRWLGLLPTDIQRLRLPAESTTALTENDRRKTVHLLGLPYVQYHRQWSHEVRLMLETGRKAEIEGLGKVDARFLPSVYLPNKIKYGGWI